LGALAHHVRALAVQIVKHVNLAALERGHDRLIGFVMRKQTGEHKLGLILLDLPLTFASPSRIRSNTCAGNPTVERLPRSI
jgi:hypothetical protein